jgi:hypothetical protein
LWRIATSSLTTSGTLSNPILLQGASTSTPVISNNEYVYLSWYKSDSAFSNYGGIVAVPVNNFSQNALVNVYGAGGTGEPVQSSPIVYSVGGLPANRTDYIYFTTNSLNGAGYAYSFATYTGSATPLWSAGGTLSPAPNQHYALQGFASDNGYLIYGDDSAGLYIMR